MRIVESHVRHLVEALFKKGEGHQITHVLDEGVLVIDGRGVGLDTHVIDEEHQRLPLALVNRETFDVLLVCEVASWLPVVLALGSPPEAGEFLGLLLDVEVGEGGYSRASTDLEALLEGLVFDLLGDDLG